MKHRYHFRRRRRIKLRLPVIIAAAAALTVLIAVRTERAVRPVAEVQACHYAELATDRIIEKAVSDYIDKNQFTYGDFAAVLYDGTGAVLSVETLPMNINRCQAELTALINERLEKETSAPVRIPVGSLTGSYILSGKGPEIKIRICPARKAEVSLKSSFTSAGNNQTCHRISAIVKADIRSSVPLYDFETQTGFEFLLAENIIIGKVPDMICN
ncbi:MAG: sporulation protein YunB [Ruminococcus sp.]|nr:sporulation protein YunB [Ruminococcus sp.]